MKKVMLTFGILAISLYSRPAYAITCQNTLFADVVALDQVFFYNRLGAVNPSGMIFALRRDVVPISPQFGLVAGNVQLRSDKRPRPIVLRMNVDDCLQIKFQNLLSPIRIEHEQPATRTASIHVLGMQLVGSIASDGSNVGTNPSSLVAPNETATYTLFAEREGGNLLYSAAAMTGGEGNGGSISAGLFGSINVEPKGAQWYRSQVTADDLKLSTISTTPDGHPIIDYDAVYPVGHRFAGLPILNMRQGNEIVHTDTNAIITGPNGDSFPVGTYRPNPAYPNRDQSFREFTVIFHDEAIVTQAFPLFEDVEFEATLHSVRDTFPINYGSSGVGAAIIANRLGVGPMFDCPECKFEEFFLTSWVLGDPAMVVDVPANMTDFDGNLILGPKATKALYPDDPSNVVHSYLNDHVKIRNIHAGPKEHHIFHLHANQWLHTPDSDNSTYLDSQALGPGSSYTYEMVYDGSGNRNKTVGDSIYHCHFYPHFAQGMWALWRTHDVFESGTELDNDGRPLPGSRALPDAEIAVGTPIPAIVPIPSVVMAPMPGTDGNPGYPFFIPGEAGHRPPHPPIDTLDDGGLARHVIVSSAETEVESIVTPLDFSKVLLVVKAKAIPEEGTEMEQAAMDFHAKPQHTSFKPDGSPGDFLTNGLPPIPGAPFADPCRDDNGSTTGSDRIYKVAAIQFDMILNKAGWHFPQARILTLWDDVQPTLDGTRPPEPLYFRANSDDCIILYHTNLVPNVYEMDDFQVRTPTDIFGQHIHLVKFDVTSSDGSANGWNYEDGTFSPDEVIERIQAIRRFNKCTGLDVGDDRDGTFTCPIAEPHPFFGTLGAQTTIQRWYADPLLNNVGEDRTLRTVFTHDHYGPTTHQQVGLYASLVVEPERSKWRDPESGIIFGSRFDGGPTSWRADILTENPAGSYREFLMHVADFQLAYTEDGVPVNPPGKDIVCFQRPCPEAIAADDVGTMSVNYRNEPIALRVRNPYTNSQAAGEAGDLSMVFSSNVKRADPRLNIQPNFYPPLTAGVEPGDPYTPLIRAYENDKIQLRIQVGAHEEGHNFSMHGTKWLFEISDPNSGWRSSQMMGISEHFEVGIPWLPIERGKHVDFLYKAGSSVEDLWNGLWGIARIYKGKRLRGDLLTLPNNPEGEADIKSEEHFQNIGSGKKSAKKDRLKGVCPKSAPKRKFKITATTAEQALPGGTLVYNPRAGYRGMLHDPTGILFIRGDDLNEKTGKIKPGVPIEPLILRANAGDCIKITLKNALPKVVKDLPGSNFLPSIIEGFNADQLTPSSHVGLHAQLVAYDVSRSDGTNIGTNKKLQTAKPGETIKYTWYAGEITIDSAGKRVATPIEFGAINLTSSDPIKHSNKGAIGALIIQPEGSTWVEDSNSRASATVTKSDGTIFRDFVIIIQNDLSLRFGDDGSAVPTNSFAEDAEDAGQKAINYRTEPLWHRMGFAPDIDPEETSNFDFTNALSNSQVGGDPVTPIFTAKVGTPVRFRVLLPGGHQRNHVFQLHGHVWEEEPYINQSKSIGSNPLSEWKGSQGGIGPTTHLNILPKHGAGGAFGIIGDYLYRDQVSYMFPEGLWGILRVTK